MNPRRKKLLFKAACLDFILIGLLTILLYLCGFPSAVIVGCFILCCAGLLLEVTHGIYLIWHSLTTKTSCRINERSSLLHSDLEAQPIPIHSEVPTFRLSALVAIPRQSSPTIPRQSSPTIPRQSSPTIPKRSAPLPIPRRIPNENDNGLIPARPWMASLPWMATSLASMYLEWRRKQAIYGRRRHTLSDCVTVSQSDETVLTRRNHTRSESAVQDFIEDF